MLTQAQLKERATYIGSSDAKVIASGDIAQWAVLAKQKLGEEEWKPNKQTQLMLDAGNHLEPFIIDQWAESNKRQVNFRGGGKTIVKKEIPLHSTFDGRVVGDNAPLEIKAHFGFKDIDELADYYAAQCQHHMIVSGSDRCYFVAFFGLRCRIEWRMLKKDDSWCDMYLENCNRFWDFYENSAQVEHDYPLPPVDHSDMYVMNMRDLEGWTEDDDHLFGFQAQHIIDAKKAIEVSDQCKNAFKSKIPTDCRRMDYDLGGNLKGHKIRVTRSRSGTLSCSHIAPKEDKND